MKAWEKFEIRLAKRFGGTRSGGSGCGNRKGDIQSSKYLIEAKETTKDCYVLTTQDILKVSSEARRVNKIPLFCIQLGNGTELALVEAEDAGIPINVKKSTQIKADMLGYTLRFPNQMFWTILRLGEIDA